ncbi:MAG: NAD(P)/FAD-dependent oxidoreductase, partial [Betaproteobacteria bacterium]
GENQHGRKVMDMQYRDWRPGSFGLGMHRGALFTLLQRPLVPAGVTCRYGANIVSLRWHGGKSLISDSEGREQGAFDVVIAADGMRSQMRAACGLPARVEPYPWGAVWTICEDRNGEFDGVLNQRYRAAREMLGILPTGRLTRDGLPLVSLFWSLRREDAQAWQAAGLQSWKSQLLSLWPQLAGLLENITDTSQLRFADYCDVRMPAWHGDGVVVIGDAAHATSPQLGQGANLALLDAWVLQRAFASSKSVAAALERYSTQRRAHLRYYQWASRMLTPLFQSDQRLLPALRDMFMGVGGRLPYVKTQSAETLAGTKTGMLFGKLRLPGE